MVIFYILSDRHSSTIAGYVLRFITKMEIMMFGTHEFVDNVKGKQSQLVYQTAILSKSMDICI